MCHLTPVIWCSSGIERNMWSINDLECGVIRVGTLMSSCNKLVSINENRARESELLFLGNTSQLKSPTAMIFRAFSLNYVSISDNFSTKKKIVVWFRRSIPIVPKKITIGIWVSITKEPFMESKKSKRIMKLLLFLIWPSSHKEIWNFVKEVMCPFLPNFVTGMYVVSTGRLCSQKTVLQTYSNFMHTFLTKVIPDNLKSLSDM